MKISIIIPNYNGYELLKKNLPEVIRNSEGAEIIVVDDKSTDDGTRLLEEKFPKVILIKKQKNEGFASTVNLGVNKSKGDLVYLLNTDIKPEKGYLKSLIEYFNDPSVFAVGSLQKCNEKDGLVLRGRGIGKFEKGFLVHKRGEVNSKNTLWVSAGAGMYRKSLWEKLGGMNTLYNPFYWEDIDLSYRALKAGYKVLFEKESIVVHEQDKGSIRNKYSASYVKSIAYRNQILFVWLNITDRKFIIGHLFHSVYQFLRSLSGGDFSFCRGFLMAISRLLSVLLLRINNARLANRSDNELI